MFIDSHAHLDFPELKPHLDAVLANARMAGVTHILTVGIDGATNQAAYDIARAHESVYASAGWHPHDVSRADAGLERHLEDFLSRPKVVALGEAGLDYYRDLSPRDTQREVFARIVRLARRLDRPLIVHCRDAFPDTFEILHREGEGQVKGVFHCFSGGPDELRKALHLGFFVSFTGNITYKNTALLPTLQAAPVDRLLLETDCPFMTPHPHRGKRNEPAYVPLVAAKIAEVKGLSVEDVARITRYNTWRLFGIGEAPEQRFVYPIRNSLYVALTSRCTNDCRFCPRHVHPVVKGHYIGMTEAEEPSPDQVIAALSDLGNYDEVVFCGFGEPTIRLEELKQIARWVKGQGRKVRLDTNGQANLIHGRDIVPELAGLVDAVSISLNEHRADLYQALVHSEFGEAAFQALLDFARRCVELLPEVTLSVVSYPGVDLEAARKVAEGTGAKFRVREYNEVG
ncbi:MAG: YchF/TatD family DNA exonuclease [Candidatus Zixiibacteriota bacterium]|nr:MAG: YchF/TatD family DNA exonuclease [candidate division Zixibacteria bacterium]